MHQGIAHPRSARVLNWLMTSLPQSQQTESQGWLRSRQSWLTSPDVMQIGPKTSIDRCEKPQLICLYYEAKYRNRLDHVWHKQRTWQIERMWRWVILPPKCGIVVLIYHYSSSDNRPWPSLAGTHTEIHPSSCYQWDCASVPLYTLRFLLKAKDMYTGNYSRHLWIPLSPGPCSVVHLS